MTRSGPASLARRAAVIARLLANVSAVAAASEIGAQPAQAIVDSASVARVAFRSAAQATTLETTLPFLMRAAHAWPTQSAYWISAARMGARLSDTGVVLEALDALARLQGGAALQADTAVQRMSQLPPVRAALARLTSNSGTLARGHVIGTIPDSTVFAEGIDAHPRTGALYVASIRQRTIFELSANGHVRNLHLERHQRLGAMLGVRVAPDGHTLYATTAGLPTMTGYVDADSALVAIVRVRIADGEVVSRWDLPPDGTPHLLGDLAIAGDGTVYATDSYAPVLYRLRSGVDTLERIRHPLFRSLQGIAPVPGGRSVIVADYSHGLLRVDLAPNAVTRIVDVAGSTSLGLDGIVWYDGGIVAVQNGIDPPRIVRYALNNALSRVVDIETLDRQPTLADEPTIGTLWRGGFAYVANSQWNKYDDRGARKPGTMLLPTYVLCVPLVPRVPQAGATTARNGTRSTASAPPSTPSCRANEARLP